MNLLQWQPTLKKSRRGEDFGVVRLNQTAGKERRTRQQNFVKRQSGAFARRLTSASQETTQTVEDVKSSRKCARQVVLKPLERRLAKGYTGMMEKSHLFKNIP